jgi:hypothetical protein
MDFRHLGNCRSLHFLRCVQLPLRPLISAPFGSSVLVVASSPAKSARRVVVRPTLTHQPAFPALFSAKEIDMQTVPRNNFAQQGRIARRVAQGYLRLVWNSNRNVIEARRRFVYRKGRWLLSLHSNGAR